MGIMTVPTRRNHHEALSPSVKSLIDLNNTMQARDDETNGTDHFRARTRMA